MKSTLLFLFAFVALAFMPAAAQTTAPAAGEAASRMTIAVDDVSWPDSLADTLEAHGGDQSRTLRRIAEAMDSRLIDRLHNTRKFTVVGRSDLNDILEDQDLQRALSPGSDANTARALEIAGAKYLLVVTIDDFQDLDESLRSDTGEVLATRRTLRLAAIGKIYDTTTGTLKESALVTAERADRRERQTARIEREGGDETDALLVELSQEAAEKIAARVSDVIFPARIVGVAGNIVMINRGDGSEIAPGQIWTAYALGEEMIDPDTGENLGAMEVPVGKVRVQAVRPRVSSAEILENFGIERYQVLRLEGGD